MPSAFSLVVQQIVAEEGVSSLAAGPEVMSGGVVSHCQVSSRQLLAKLASGGDFSQLAQAATTADCPLQIHPFVEVMSWVPKGFRALMSRSESSSWWSMLIKAWYPAGEFE